MFDLFGDLLRLFLSDLIREDSTDSLDAIGASQEFATVSALSLEASLVVLALSFTLVDQNTLSSLTLISWLAVDQVAGVFIYNDTLSFLTDRSLWAKSPGTVVEALALVAELEVLTFIVALVLVLNTCSLLAGESISAPDKGTVVRTDSLQTEFVLLASVWWKQLLTGRVVVTHEVLIDADVAVSEKA